MTKITFEDEFGVTSKLVDQDEITWIEAIELFKDVLRGAGYVIDYED